jgi:hypothetical protein
MALAHEAGGRGRKVAGGGDKGVRVAAAGRREDDAYFLSPG